jgi:iron complex transport system substrate-binding protein
MQRAHPSTSNQKHVACFGMVLAVSLLAGCASPQTEAPQRAGIVSLNPCTDAILAKVAAPAQIKALSAYSRNPNSSSMDVAVAEGFASTTGTVEEIAALQPALVISGNFTPPATRQALARLNIRLVEFPIASTVDESVRQVQQIAALTGHSERGEALTGEIRAALSAAKPTDNRAIPALVWQSGGIVPGDETLIADLLRRTGFANAAAARGLKQADFLPLERVLADPPAVILAAGDKSGEDRMLAHPALSGLKATQRASFDSRLLWCGGPTIVEAARRLAEVRRTVVSAPTNARAR